MCKCVIVFILCVWAYVCVCVDVCVSEFNSVNVCVNYCVLFSCVCMGVYVYNVYVCVYSYTCMYISVYA